MKLVTKDGKVIEIDWGDYIKFLKDRNFNISSHGYVRILRFDKYQYLHRLILGIEDSKIQVDHIDGNRLNNTRSNLRVSTDEENNRNKKPTKSNISGYKGVHFNKLTRKWRSQITVNYKVKSLGSFDTAEKAALAYNEAAKKFHGEFAYLNKV